MAAAAGHRGAFPCKLWKKFAQVCSVCSGHILFKVCTVLAPLPGRCANFFSDRKKFAHFPGRLLRMMSKLLIKFGCHLRCLPRKVCKLLIKFGCHLHFLPRMMSKLLIKFGCRLRCLFILMSKLFPHCVQTLHRINVFYWFPAAACRRLALGKRRRLPRSRRLALGLGALRRVSPLLATARSAPIGSAHNTIDQKAAMVNGVMRDFRTCVIGYIKQCGNRFAGVENSRSHRGQQRIQPKIDDFATRICGPLVTLLFAIVALRQLESARSNATEALSTGEARSRSGREARPRGI